MTPNDGTPLSEIACTYSAGSTPYSPGLSPMLFCLLENSPRPPTLGGNGAVCSRCNASVTGSSCRCSVIGSGLSAIKAEPSSSRKSVLLTKRKLEDSENDVDGSFASTDHEISTDLDNSAADLSLQ